MVMSSYQQTRDSIGSTDQTRDLVFAGLIKEKLKIKVVNEVVLKKEFDGLVLDSDIYGGLDSENFGLDGKTYIVEEVVRRRWNWNSFDELRKSNSAYGYEEGMVEINLSLD